LNPVN